MCGRCCRFLIASAPLFFCHALCKSVIEQITKRGEIVVPLVAVHAVIDGDIPNIALGKETLGIVAHFQIVPAHAGHILDNDGSDLSRLGQPDHLIPARTVKRHPGNTIVNEKRGIGETVVSRVLQKDFLLERDLSRGISPYTNEIDTPYSYGILYYDKKAIFPFSFHTRGKYCFRFIWRAFLTALLSGLDLRFYICRYSSFKAVPISLFILIHLCSCFTAADRAVYPP